MHQRIKLVARFHGFTPLAVSFRIGFGILHHAFDIGVRKARLRLNANLLFLAGRLVLRADADNAVRVNVKGHFHLRHATRRGGNARQVESAKLLVIGSHFTFALIDLDGDRGLIVIRGGEGLAFLRRDRRVAINQARKHAAEGFNTKAERRHIQQQHILDIALQHAALNGRANGDDFIGVDVARGFLAEELANRFHHFRHARHAADKDHLIHLIGGKAGILQRLAAGFHGAADQIIHQSFQL